MPSIIHALERFSPSRWANLPSVGSAVNGDPIVHSDTVTDPVSDNLSSSHMDNSNIGDFISRHVDSIHKLGSEKSCIPHHKCESFNELKNVCLSCSTENLEAETLPVSDGNNIPNAEHQLSIKSLAGNLNSSSASRAEIGSRVHCGKVLLGSEFSLATAAVESNISKSENISASALDQDAMDSAEQSHC